MIERLRCRHVNRRADAAGNDEILQREAIDALYYPLFLAVRRMIGAPRSRPRGSQGEHQIVIEALKTRGVVGQRAGNQLDYLRVLRNKAKYEDKKKKITAQDLLSARNHAALVLSLLPDVLAGG